MSERIPKCIIHDFKAYPYILNEFYFDEYLSGSLSGCQLIILILNENPDLDGNAQVNQVPFQECLFIFEDDFDKYPEYFI
jgi:hypothetical protein